MGLFGFITSSIMPEKEENKQFERKTWSGLHTKTLKLSAFFRHPTGLSIRPKAEIRAYGDSGDNFKYAAYCCQ